MRDHLKAGEFARLCRTTKETLRHYDRLGILKPAVRAENGYKLYSYLQVMDFMLISSLQTAGLSLKDVGALLNEPDRGRLEAAIEERIDALEEQCRELKRRQNVLGNTLARSRQLVKWLGEPCPCDGSAPLRLAEVARDTVYQTGRYRWCVSELEEAYYIDTRAQLQDATVGEVVDTLLDHLAYCERGGWGEELQGALRIGAASVASGRYLEDMALEFRVDAAVDSPRLHVRPAGTYVRWLNEIDLASVSGNGMGSDSLDEPNPVFEAYDALRAFAARQGWRLVGDLYDSDMSLYSGSVRERVYTEIVVRVEDDVAVCASRLPAPA